MADGLKLLRTVPLVKGGRMGFAIIRATSKPGIVAWAVRDSGGRRLTGGAGPPGAWRRTWAGGHRWSAAFGAHALLAASAAGTLLAAMAVTFLRPLRVTIHHQ